MKTALYALLPLVATAAHGQLQPQVNAAASRALQGPAAVPFRECFTASAGKFGLSEKLLWAIAKVESNFDAWATHRNTNGSVDMGVMQVNSVHLPRLLERGINEYHLIRQPCTNIDIGASILADFVRQHGMTWRAVGAYGAGNATGLERSREDYVAKVRTALQRIEGAPVALGPSTPAARPAAHPADASLASAASARPQLLVME